MWSRYFGLLLSGVAGASPAATCPAQPRTTAGLLATEKAWVAALEQRDTAALACILDPTFSDNDWRGESVDRTTVLASLPHRAATRLHLSELSSTIGGSMALVRGLNTQVDPDGKIVATVRFTDVFAYRDMHWRAVAAQETLVRPPDK